jgi:tRNA U38,U39,U40 pseudouridine synthase TruA
VVRRLVGVAVLVVSGTSQVWPVVRRLVGVAVLVVSGTSQVWPVVRRLVGVAVLVVSGASQVWPVVRRLVGVAVLVVSGASALFRLALFRLIRLAVTGVRVVSAGQAQHRQAWLWIRPASRFLVVTGCR